VSNWLHEHMRPGVELKVSGPNGHFNCFDFPNQKLLLIAAGSGITPIMSMLRWLADTRSTCDIAMLNNVRTPLDVIFEQELRYLGSRLGQHLRLAIVPGRVAAGQAWNGAVGRFGIEQVRMIAPDFAEREAFVCGPEAYMRTVRETLEQHAFPMHRYHEESFGAAPAAEIPGAARPVAAPAPELAVAAPAAAAAAAAAAQPVAPAAPDQCEIEFRKSGKTIACSSDDFVLDVGETAGIALASSCRAGNCGTCKIRLVEGSLDMDGQQALTEADLADGYVLACIGRARSARLVLDV
jgi:ferredoxin-NADP reductase